jgi:hypothetical protein
MYKRLYCFVLAVVLCGAGSSMAQRHPLEGPMLGRGTKELALSGTFDFQHEGDPLLDLRGTYGYFLQNNLEVGGFAEIAGDFDQTFRYELGGFAELHFPRWAFLQGKTVPYLGADLALSFVDTDIGDDNAALTFRPRVGLKWFIRDYFAIDTSLFFALATDDLFPNKTNDLDPYDIGMRLGIRVFFK